jgi:hypothetical protein
MPKPGPQIKLVNNLFNRLVEIVDAKNMDPTLAENACSDILDKIGKNELTVDAIQELTDRLLRAAEADAAMAHNYHIRSAIYQETARRAHSHFGFVMKQANLTETLGETWLARIVDTEPKIDIDPKKLLAAGKFIVQVPMIDEKKLMEALKSGEEIPGVTRTPQTVVNFVLQKREQAN